MPRRAVEGYGLTVGVVCAAVVGDVVLGAAVVGATAAVGVVAPVVTDTLPGVVVPDEKVVFELDWPPDELLFELPEPDW